MKAVKTLPPSYAFHSEVDLSKNIKLALLLNIAGIASFLLYGWLFLFLSVLIRKIIPLAVAESVRPPSTLGTILETVAAFLLVLTLHEAVHGLFFFLITRERPIFGFRGAFAYAAAPGWYILRNPYLVVGLSPWILITMGGLVAAIFVPNNILLPLLFGMTINASGAIGDLYIVAWLLGQPKQALINDRGDAITVYCSEERVKEREYRY
jgi:hypothetical protein